MNTYTKGGFYLQILQTQTGGLIVSVFNTTVALPIASARVIISQVNEQGEQEEIADIH